MFMVNDLDKIYALDTTVKEMIYLSCEEFKDSILTWTGFDLFTSPRFIESFVCALAGYRQSNKQAPFDGRNDQEIFIEVKHSNLIQRKNGTKQYMWQNLRGTHNRGKQAHVFILVGYNPNFKQIEDQLMFFAIPHYTIGKRKSLTYSLCAKKKRPKWSEYVVGYMDLKAMIEQRYEEQVEWLNAQKKRQSSAIQK